MAVPNVEPAKVKCAKRCYSDRNKKKRKKLSRHAELNGIEKCS